MLTSNHRQLETGWCERSEADQLGNPLVFGQACFQRACKPASPCSPGEYKGGGEQPLCFAGGMGGAQMVPPMKP
ncbi:MAG: hypothetical protein NTW61_10315 [Candidatus Melainabacteria bacterium]|nr:hypothetical protein [Candidatus Melainabacteria bacterium]